MHRRAGLSQTSVNLKPCNLAAYIDRSIFNENHMWQQSKVYDPEGLLSTIPAVVTTISACSLGNGSREGMRAKDKG